MRGLTPKRLGLVRHVKTRSTLCPRPSAVRHLSTTSTLSHPGQSKATSQAATSASTFSSINSSEISHFSSLSSQWWDPAGELALLHRMNPTRIEYIRQKVALDSRDEEPWTFENRHTDQERQVRRSTGKWLEGKRCLDVGCGGGLLSEGLARLGGDVLGIDAAESNITIADIHASQDPFLPYSPATPPQPSSWLSTTTPSRSKRPTAGSLEYRPISAEKLRDAGETFDVVCAMEVLEHVDEPGEFMRCLGDMLNPGGHLILSTISRTPLSRLLTLTLAENVLRLVSPGTHTYAKFVKPHEIRRYLHDEMGGHEVWEENLNASDVRKGQVGETKGIVYNPLKGDWVLWEGAEGTWGKELGERCNYMFHARKKR